MRKRGKVGCNAGTVKTVLTWTAKPRTDQTKRRIRSLRRRTSIAATMRPGRGSCRSEEVPVLDSEQGGEGGVEDVLSGTGERREEEARRQRDGSACRLIAE